VPVRVRECRAAVETEGALSFWLTRWQFGPGKMLRAAARELKPSVRSSVWAPAIGRPWRFGRAFSQFGGAHVADSGEGDGTLGPMP
jgi:hypothetical protein